MLFLMLAAISLLTAMPAPADGPPPLVLVTYHGVSDDPDASNLTVTPESLRTQIREAKAAGWTFLPLADVLSRLERTQELPGPVMVLTFDDGYRNFRERALPILEEEGVPAALAVVSSFATDPPEEVPPTLSWEEIREVDGRSSFEVVSHSDDLHQWVVNNPSRDTSPSVTTRRYLVAEGRYEDRDEYHARILADMRAARQRLRAELERDVTVLVWPYGEHNQTARRLAAEAGFDWTLALGDRPVTAEDVASRVLPRYMMTRHMHLPGPVAAAPPAQREIRAVQVDLDTLFDEDVDRFRGNLDRLISRISASGATHVILQTCADPRGDGKLGEAWFMNHQLPVKADVWAAAAAKFHHAGLKVWARAPVLNLAWEWSEHADWRIPRDPRLPRHEPWYYRISPDVPEARTAALDFYGDLAVYLPIDGVLFDDDAYLLPDERLARSGLADPAAKSDAIHALIREIMATVRTWRPEARFGRKLYAPVVETEGIHPLFSQDLDRFLEEYDLTVVRTYAHTEGHGDVPHRWVQQLVRRAQQRWTGESNAPLLFTLQAYDWQASRWLGEQEILRQVAAARRAGARQLGIYPVSPDEGSLPEAVFTETPRPRGKRR